MDRAGLDPRPPEPPNELVRAVLRAGEHQRASHGVVFEDTLDLEDGPLTSAYGSRLNSHGDAGCWAVVTDGISTVDVAAYDAWSSAGSVRYEIEPDGRFRIIAPYTSDPIRTFYHFLITPPADHYHTPAAAMVADPHIRLLDAH